MKRILLLCALLVGQTAFGQMTHEETMVRTAYARLAYGVAQGAISNLTMEAMGHPVSKEDAVLTKAQRFAAAEMRFELSDFVLGNFKDIVDSRIGDLVTPALVGELDVNPNGYTFTADGVTAKWNWFIASWHKKPQGQLPSPGVEPMTVVEAMRMSWGGEEPTNYQRFASYTVKMSFQGKEHGPYKAMFLFGLDTNNNEVIKPIDPTTGNNALASALHDQLFPHGLVSTRLRSFPVVAEWIDANKRPNSSCSTVIGSREICCDLEAMKCGPGSDDVARARLIPLPMATHAPPTTNK